MLVLNGSNAFGGARCRFVGANSFVGFRTSFGTFARGNSALGNLGFARTSSIPHGLRGGVAMQMAITDGGISAYIAGLSSTVAPLDATANLTSTLTGSGTVTFGNLAGGINVSTTLTGSGTVSNAPLPAFGNLTCSISIGARPSATDIAQAVWEELLTGHTTSNTAAKILKDKLSRNDYIGLS